MLGSKIARRYAQALFELCDAKDYQKILKQMKDFVATIKKPELQHLFVSPAFAVEEKQAVLQDLFAGLKLDSLLQQFNSYLLEHGRLLQVEAICHCFNNLVNEALNRIQVDVTSAVSLKKVDKDKFLATLKKVLDKEVEVNWKVDKEIIGGAVTRVGSTIYDGSIYSRLEGLKASLASQV